VSLNEHFDLGVQEMIINAQAQANELGKSIRVGNQWVNPSSAALARRHKNIVNNFFEAEAESRRSDLKRSKTSQSPTLE
jgi:hypothetical protein